MIAEEIKKAIKKSLGNLGITFDGEVCIEHPANLDFGDYSTNIAMICEIGSFSNKSELADSIIGKLNKNLPKEVEKVEVAGNGFINFFLTKDFFVESIKEILDKKDDYGKNNLLNKQKTIVEYTDPNPFKEFHIGHLMSNTIGEAISRIIEWNGAEVKRANYQGDIGVHVAMSVWAMQKENKKREKITPNFLGEMYTQGARAYKDNKKSKKEIDEINTQIYNNKNKELLEIYKLGRNVSLEYFEEIYKKLGTKFDYYFFESSTGKLGGKIVDEYLKNGLFEESEGAIVFKGEKYGLHTRVFRNSNGISTYEAKELGLAKIKYKKYRYDKSVIITGNEINDYFKVLLKVMSFIYPNLAKKTKHIGHGMLRLPKGKMSSRTGDVITFLSLYQNIYDKIFPLVKDSSNTSEQAEKTAEEISIATLKYPILKQGVGKDVVFDVNKSISFEGDSGPYLQYTIVRANAVLEKAILLRQGFGGQENLKIKESIKQTTSKVSILEKLLYRFPEVIIKAGKEFSPSYISTYLTELASAFNAYYAKNKIITDDSEAGYRLALTKAVSIVMKNGLEIMGIKIPEKM